MHALPPPPPTEPFGFCEPYLGAQRPLTQQCSTAPAWDQLCRRILALRLSGQAPHQIQELPPLLLEEVHRHGAQLQVEGLLSVRLTRFPGDVVGGLRQGDGENLLVLLQVPASSRSSSARSTFSSACRLAPAGACSCPPG